MKQIIRYGFFLFAFIAANYTVKAQGVDGNFYSLVYYSGGGTYNDYGTFNFFNPGTNIDSSLLLCNQANGWRPYGNFIQLDNGLLYGFMSYGGNGGTPGYGTIISYNIQTEQDTVLYRWPGSGVNGLYNYGTPCHATNDSLYGLTYVGGTHNQGTLFSFNYHTGGFTLLSNLKALAVGSEPAGGVIQATNGLLYGLTTNDSLPGNTGTIFSYNITTGALTLLYVFQNTPDGYYPRGNLLQINDSMLYGLTQDGGVNDSGCIFSYNINRNATKVVYSFTGKPDGSNPEQSLMLANDGKLYGTTAAGGAYDFGTIFNYDITTNTEKAVYSFQGPPNDGAAPFDDLIQATDGLLYGNTNKGGLRDSGAIFSYNIATQVETLRTSYTYLDGNLPYGDFLEVMSAYVTAVSDSCANDSDGSLTIHVKGGKPPFTYTWSTGATTSSISNLPGGTYTCSVSDSRGITFSFQDTITPLPTLVSFVVSNTCFGDSNGSAATFLSGGTPPFTFTWNNGATTDTVYNLAPGTYTCNITDEHGCTARGIVTITQAPQLAINSITATQQTFPNYNNGIISVSVSGGIPPGDVPCYHYLWSNGAPDSSIIYGLDSGTYAVCVTSCYGCGSVCDSAIIVSTGIQNIGTNNKVNVYPVPSNGLITIALNGNGFENLVITDALGRIVYAQTLSLQNRNNLLHIDLSALSDGVYIMQVNSAQGVLTRKIIIQK